MTRATVHVDLANKSCVILDGDTQHGAWAPNITRRTAETAIAKQGWMFAPGSEWQMTVDGGVRDVVLHPVTEDDRLLNALGSAVPGSAGPLADDELNALLLTWRQETERRPVPELVDTETASTVLAAVRPELDDAVWEHTAHSAITTARGISATVAAEYDPAAQSAAELLQADADLDALAWSA